MTLQVIALSLGAISVIALVVLVATGQRRRMARHPAPTFVFADLVGYTSLTEERGEPGPGQRNHARRRGVGR